MCKAQSAEAVPNCFGTRDQFCGRQFLDGLGTGRVILQDAVKKDSRGLSQNATGNPGFTRLVPVTAESF